MQWAREHQNADRAGDLPYRSLREFSGHTERRRQEHQSKQQQDFRRVLRDVARDDFVQERRGPEKAAVRARVSTTERWQLVLHRRTEAQ